MKYTLNELSKNNYSNTDSIIEDLLKNRGVENTDKYMNPKKEYEYDYNLLGDIDKAVECLISHINKDSNIFMIADSDADGISSNSILYNYLKSSFKNIKLTYGIHSGKQHGITNDIKIPENTNLLIVTDAGSNDIEQCKLLKEQGVDVIILDHHQLEAENPYCILINNQLHNYPNKSLCGAGVVYKFLQALDEELWQNKADDYLDLVALGLIGDSMDITNLETKYYIDKGLKNIRNEQLKAFIKKQDYSIKGLVNINNIAFYITPLINAMIRIGKQDEKELMYKGFTEDFEEFDYKPSGKDKGIVKEDIYTRVARFCGNTKSRQDKLRDKALLDIVEIIEDKGKTEDKVLLINCDNKCNLGILGVVAMKVAETYNKPTVLLNRNEDGIFRGSARNTDKNNIKNFKNLLNDTELFIFNQGHNSAFGSAIESKNVVKAIKLLNEQLKDYDFSANSYVVDYIIPFDELIDDLVYTIVGLKNIWGKGLGEPLIAIKNVEVLSSEIEIIGKKSDTLKFEVDGVEFILFRTNSEDKLVSSLSDWEDNDKLFTLEIVGKCNTNQWNGVSKPQIEIVNYNICEIK